MTLSDSRQGRRVGIRIVTFEACSSFTHVTAHWIAQSPQGDLCHEAPALPVAQPNHSSATGSIDNSPGGSSSTDDSRLRGARPIADMRYALAANKSHRPGRPLSSNDPRSENFKPAPATRSVTTRDTNTSFEPDCAMTRAAA